MERLSVIVKSFFAGLAMTTLVAGAFYGLAKAGASFLGAVFILFGIPSALLLAILVPNAVMRRFDAFVGSSDQGFATLCILGALIQLLIICTICSYRLWFSRKNQTNIES